MNAKLDVRKYHDGASWVFNKAVSGGGCLIDSAINAISIIVSVVGPITASAVRYLMRKLALGSLCC